jgi:hypothetical protein
VKKRPTKKERGTVVMVVWMPCLAFCLACRELTEGEYKAKEIKIKR